ncbi:MAG: fructose PTS transporter subunit IIA [Enterococcaceae bacterium]|jgi:PTS system fructose-specific IIA component|nr:fructose PTS transporter subunit IIA [Enterococcaceae bacterium]MCI1919767.1 fructose PTS transporter subunit IIA [Enterococcaceae bacterium]
MEVNEIIDPRNVRTRLSAQTKDEALKELATTLFNNGYISDIAGFITDIYMREAEGQTGIGNFIAIPHGKSTYVKKIGVAIGVADKEIPWESLDGRGVKGIILFAVGNDNEGAHTHLKLLSLFARKLGNDEVVKKLIEAKDTAQVIAAFA